MSGRRRSRSAGIPTLILAGGVRHRSRLANGCVYVARRHAEKHGKRVLRLGEVCLQCGDLGLRVVEQSGRFLHVELGCHPVIEAHLGEIEALCLGGHVRPGKSQFRLQFPDRDIGGCNVTDERNEDIVIIGDLHDDVGRRGLDAPPDLAPEIELPACVEAGRPRLERRVEGRVNLADLLDYPNVLGQPFLLVAGTDLLALRKPVAENDAELRASLIDAHRGDLECQVLREGDIDELVENRIVEPLPPFDGRLAARADPGARCAGPPGLLGRQWRDEIRPDHRATRDERRGEDGQGVAAGSRKLADSHLETSPLCRLFRPAIQRLSLAHSLRSLPFASNQRSSGNMKFAQL